MGRRAWIWRNFKGHSFEHSYLKGMLKDYLRDLIIDTLCMKSYCILSNEYKTETGRYVVKRTKVKKEMDGRYEGRYDELRHDR